MRRRLLRRLTVAGCALPLLLTPQLASASGTATDGERGHERPSASKRVGYFTAWSASDRGYRVKDLVTSGVAKRLTHLNYAFGNVSPEGKCIENNVPGEGRAWIDYQKSFSAKDSVDGKADKKGQRLAGNFNQIRELKAKNPRLKVLMSLGGWEWSTYFSNAARTPESRKAFVSSCIDLFIKGNLPKVDGRGGPGSAAGVFDGIDLDWEWPNWPGEEGNVYRPEDKKNFTALVAEFRRQLDAYERKAHRQLLLTAFLPANPDAMDAGYEGRKFFRHLDYATLQGYDLHGAWESRTNQQSAIDSPDDSLSQVVRDWRARGATNDKIVLGIPFFGRGWTGVEGGGNGYQQPAAGPAPGTWEAGFEDYKVLKSFAESGDYTLHRSAEGGHAWLFDGTTFWTYDDPEVMAQKAEFINDENLAGAMFWSLDGDDAEGELFHALTDGLD